MEIDWHKILLHSTDWELILEILVRTLIMFIMVLVVLRSSGKKGVRQLSFFEVAIIISLGSAAGDPMFNEDVPILPALFVFAIILSIYRFLTWLAAKYEKVETVLEGTPEYVIENGMFNLKSENKHSFAKDEFLSEMRQASIEHLGQVRIAILETTGNVSFFYYSNEDVKYGMPVLPKEYCKMSKEIKEPGLYACTYCGNVQNLAVETCCERCDNGIWLKAINTTRIS